MNILFPLLEDGDPTTLEDLLAQYKEKRASFETCNSLDEDQSRIGNTSSGSYYAWLLVKPFNKEEGEIPQYVGVPELYLPEEVLFRMENGNYVGVANVVRYARQIDNKKREKDPRDRFTFPFRLEDTLSNLGLNESKLNEILRKVYSLYYASDVPKNVDFDSFIAGKVQDSLQKIRELSRVDYRSLSYSD